MSLNTDYGNYNEDDFVQNSSDLRELTVTITLSEYRYLIAEQTRNEIEIDRLKELLKKKEEQAKLMAEIVLFDHPEFIDNIIGDVKKFFEKANEAEAREDADGDERTGTA